MSFNVALALIVGDVLGVFSTIIIVGLAFAVKEKKNDKQEDTEQHE